MSYFEGQGVNWSQHRRQQSWDQSQNGASNGTVFARTLMDNWPYHTTGAGPQRDDNPAFGSQFEGQWTHPSRMVHIVVRTGLKEGTSFG